MDGGGIPLGLRVEKLKLNATSLQVYSEEIQIEVILVTDAGNNFT